MPKSVALSLIKGFPYYIVRFKLRYYVKELFAFVCFHTTQYDLNFVIYFPVTRMFSFPYYIVRFKPYVWKKELKYEKNSFHTTQYDLNYGYSISDYDPASRFHTTQYDLNEDVVLPIAPPEEKFPYYIVRFKLSFRHLNVLPRNLVSILHSTI